jgi:hypothetical protein
MPPCPPLLLDVPALTHAHVVVCLRLEFEADAKICIKLALQTALSDVAVKEE